MNKPKLIQHVCKSEPGCLICKNYINKLEEYRQSITGVRSKRKIIFRLVGTSKLDKDSEGKGQVFDLPKPRLIQTINNMK